MTYQNTTLRTSRQLLSALGNSSLAVKHCMIFLLLTVIACLYAGTPGALSFFSAAALTGGFFVHAACLFLLIKKSKDSEVADRLALYYWIAIPVILLTTNGITKATMFLSEL